MSIKTIKEFAAESNLPEDLIRATVRQAGGWSSFKEMAEDVTNHGASGGFSGFIYYTDTVKFYNNNRDSIKDALSDMASNLGEGVMEMVAGFNCLKGSVTADEVGVSLYGAKRDVDTQVANALAWYALEEVSRSYCDLI